MALGNTLLAAWDVDGVLRTYEYGSDGKFVQLNSFGGVTHAPGSTALSYGADPAPYLYWDFDDSLLVVIRAATSALMVTDSFSPLLAKLQATQTILNQANGAGGKYATFESWHEHVFVSSAIQFAIPFRVLADGTRQLSSVPNTNFFGNTKITDAAPFRDNVYLTFGYPDGMPNPAMNFIEWTGGSTDPRMVFNNTPIFGLRASLMSHSYNNRTLAVVDAVSRLLKIYVRKADVYNFDFLHDLPLPVGVPKKITMCRDNKMMAISCLDGTTWNTNIYRRVGDYFRMHQELTGIGSLLEFSIDGVLLIDCALKKCYIREGETYVANHDALVNIPSLTLAQAVSQARVYPYGFSYVYDDAVQRLAQDNVDLTDLKLDLLLPTASFDPTATTITAVTGGGAHRVTTGQWPVGGKPLGTVVGVIGTGTDRGTYALDVDPLTWVVLDSNLTARYGVVYEASTGKPVMWMDFIQTRTIAKNREMIINFRDSELLKFVK